MSAKHPSWPWQRMNEGNVGAHALLSALLDPRPGERWLDVGTGGGGLALQLAKSGADVVGVDIAEDGLDHAREAAAAEGVSATFEYGDAQELPFPAAAFDGVASAFGVIFAADPERTAAELARVCRPEGKLGLTLMPMDSRTGEVFSLLERYGRRASHPGKWSEDAEALLEGAFELEVERRESPAPHQHTPLSWEESVQSFAPLRDVVERLDDDAVVALRAELDTIDERYREAAPSYFIALGRRR